MMRTRILSVLACAWMLAFAGQEIIATARAVALSENLDWKVVGQPLVLEAMIALAFVVRLIELARIDTSRYTSVAGSWIVCATLVWLYFTERFPGDGTAIYFMIEPDSLATWSWVYVLLSGVRFVITALSAGMWFDDSDSYS